MKRLICFLIGHAWSDWFPLDPKRVIFEPFAPYEAGRVCRRCERLEPETRKPDQMPNGDIA